VVVPLAFYQRYTTTAYSLRVESGVLVNMTGIFPTLAAQGVVAGANMVLVDFHPAPPKALVDGPQAMLLKELPYFLEDVQIAREAYLKRVALRQSCA